MLPTTADRRIAAATALRARVVRRTAGGGSKFRPCLSDGETRSPDRRTVARACLSRPTPPDRGDATRAAVRRGRAAAQASTAAHTRTRLYRHRPCRSPWRVPVRLRPPSCAPRKTGRRAQFRSLQAQRQAAPLSRESIARGGPHNRYPRPLSRPRTGWRARAIVHIGRRSQLRCVTRCRACAGDRDAAARRGQRGIARRNSGFYRLSANARAEIPARMQRPDTAPPPHECAGASSMPRQHRFAPSPCCAATNKSAEKTLSVESVAAHVLFY